LSLLLFPERVFAGASDRCAYVESSEFDDVEGRGRKDVLGTTPNMTRPPFGDIE
jgi:hypothetical protein